MPRRQQRRRSLRAAPGALGDDAGGGRGGVAQAAAAVGGATGRGAAGGAARVAAPGGDARAAVRRRRGTGSGQGRGGFANMSEEDRKKMTDLRQKMQAATREERAKLQKEMQELMAKAGITGGQGRGQGRGGAGGAPAAAGGGFGVAAAVARRASAGADPIAAMIMRRGANVGGYTDEERKNAKLPLPPEQDSQVQVLLRPGLLADVEIQVEKIPERAARSGAGGLPEERPVPGVRARQRTASSKPRGTAGEAERIDDGAVSGVTAGRDCRHGRSHCRTRTEERREEIPGGGNPMSGMPGGK